MNTLVLILDLIGTFVFALSGATMGVRRRLDIFGVLVLSFAAALAGGITRDLLIGATPVAAISDWRYRGSAGNHYEQGQICAKPLILRRHVGGDLVVAAKS